MSFLLTLIIFGILIVVHEFGHFIAARRSGVKVERFAIGFGPPILKIKGKQTEFVICIFPLGGYVKLAGDNRSEYKGSSNEFLSQTPGVRGRIIFAGVFFNYLFALIIFWIIALVGFPYQDTVIGGVFKDYPAYNSGLQSGDRIISVDGKEIVGWSQMERTINESKDKVGLGLERDGKVLAIEIPLVQEEIVDDFGRKKQVSLAGIFPYQNTTIGSLLDNYPAKEAGLKSGDIITAVDGVYVDNWKEMAELIHKSKSRVSLGLRRNGEEKSLVIPVKQEEIIGISGEKEVVSLIGIGPYSELKFKRYSFFKGLIKGARTLLGLTADIMRGLYSIISGAISFKEGAAGPIGIFYITSEYVKVGVIAVLQLMATLNVSLAIINLFPIPVLDGGHMLFLLLEKIRKKPASERTEELATRLGLTFIAVIFLFITYNDIVRFGSGVWNNFTEGSSQVWDKLRSKVK